MSVRPVLAALVLSLALAAPALPDPPSHAPAHGYRNKHDGPGGKPRKYRGYTGTEWAADYGVQAGRCNTDTVLAAVGAVTGAVIGNRTADPENRTIATIIGAIAGGVIGNQIGEAIDDGDRACMGHALEIGATGRAVSWTNPRTRMQHTLRPVRDLPGGCRQFEYRGGNVGQMATMTACRAERGAWTIRTR